MSAAARPGLLTLLAILAGPALLGLQGSSTAQEAPPRPAAAPAPSIPLDRWLPVHPERQARLAGLPIYGVCFDGSPPRKLAGSPPQLAPGSRFRRRGGVLLAHCLIDREGYVVQAQVLKAPDPADQQAVARALAGWRFAPALHDGQPAAVHFLVSIPVPRDP